MPVRARSLARRAAAVALLLMGALPLGGCFNPFAPDVFREGGVASNAPVPNTPENTLLLLRWCWTNRAADVYEEIFTDDYVFVFAATDSAGNAFRDRPFTREDDLISFRNMCNGGGSEPPASSISLTFDPTLVSRADSRDGKRNKWHRVIRTSVALTVRTESQSYESQGSALYYFVRGDSAAIPEALQQRGMRPDSTRWWIDRWEDQTLGTSGLLAETLLRARGEPIRSVAVRVSPAADERPAASPGPATPATVKAPATASANEALYEPVSLGYVKQLFWRLR